MKKSWAFLGAGAIWILFSGLVWIRPVPFPSSLPSPNLPLAEPAFELSSSQRERAVSSFSELDRKWKVHRALATSA